MNIFYTDYDPEVAARNMVDRHVVKMILETAQLLSTAHRVLDGEMIVGKNDKGRKTTKWTLPDARDTIIYASTHRNHPSAIWVRESAANYNWLYSHLLALGREYTYRYGRTHLTIDKLESVLKQTPNNIPQSKMMTKMPSCMDKQYIISLDPIINYRNYYNYGKTDLLRWSNRPPPQWIDGTIIVTDGKKQIYTIQR
jgi:hypothetical protein